MKIIKKLILLIWFLFVWSFFIWNSISLADSSLVSNKTSDNSVSSKNLWIYQTLWKWLYTITWPLIVIAWNFMDNHMIYWTFIWMDTLLWKIWNVIRTFANYIIWLILIFSIFTLFMWWKLEQFNPMKIIPQLVVSAVLVNASWFLIWACIDVSNILTYSIWNLPITIAWNVKDSWINKLEIPTFSISLQNKDKPLTVWIYNGWNFLPYCKETSLSGSNWIKYLSTNGKCVVGYNMRYYQINSWDTWDYKWNHPWTVIELHNFSELKTKLTGMTWILWTIFASIVNSWRLVNNLSWTDNSMIMSLIMNSIFLFAMVIPLFTLAVILIVRVVILWMFIIISPIVFLFTSVKNFEKVLWEKWKLSQLCCMVFMPVIVVFALSISLVFLSSLKSINISNQFWISWTWSTLNINIDWSNDKSHNIQMTFINKSNDNALTNLFSNLWWTIDWIIRSIFSVWFMWVIVFAALKSCKITSWIAGSIQWFSQNIMKATPIVPIAWWQSVSSIWAWLSNLQSWPDSKQSSQFKHWLWAYLDELQNNTSWDEKTHIKETDKVFNNYTNKANPVYNVVSNDSYKNLELNNLLKNPKDIKDIANKLWIDESSLTIKLKDLAKKDWNIKLSDIVGTLEKDVISIKLWKYASKGLKDLSTTDITNIANTLWIDEHILTIKLKDLAKKYWTKKLSDITNDILNVIKLSKLKKDLNDNVIAKHITLLQLSDDVKDQIKTLLKTEISQNRGLAIALKNLWFDNNDIVKLMAKNIIWNNSVVSPSEKSNILKFLE